MPYSAKQQQYPHAPIDKRYFNLKKILPGWRKEFFRPKRMYRILYGGRGSSKTTSFARAMAVLCTLNTRKALCLREFQNSLKDSAQPAIKKAFRELGVDHLWSGKSELKCENGSEITFLGMARNQDSLRELEDINVCWVEACHQATEESMEILMPSLFRTEPCEFWASFNPQYEDDWIYKTFITETMDEAEVLKVNYTDNEFFPEGLNKQRIDNKKKLPQEIYDHIWNGECKPLGTGGVFDLKEYDRCVAEELPIDDVIEWSIGIDLAINNDLACVSYLGKTPNIYVLIHDIYICQKMISMNPAKDYAPYVRSGDVTVVGENEIRLEAIFEQIESDIREGMRVKKIVPDPHEGRALLQSFKERNPGILVENFVASHARYNTPMSRLSSMMVEKSILIGKNDLARWCYGNVDVDYNDAMQGKPVKSGLRNNFKIDPAVSSILATEGMFGETQRAGLWVPDGAGGYKLV